MGGPNAGAGQSYLSRRRWQAIGARMALGAPWRPGAGFTATFLCLRDKRKASATRTFRAARAL